MADTEVVSRKPDRPGDDAPLVDEQLADELLARAQEQGAELLGPDGLLSQVAKVVLERALGEDLTDHLGYEKHDPAGRGSGNSRNGSTPKRLLTEIGGIDLAWPNSTLLGGDVPAQVPALRDRPGGNLVIMGSGQLIRSLLSHGLIDELFLMIHPVLLGSGNRLFGPDEQPHRLRLLDATPTASGVLMATYQWA